MNGAIATVAPAQFLSFYLGQDMFAMSILAVREILEYAGVTPVPQMPPAICGVINLRGRAVPVLHLARHLERQTSVVTKRTCIIVVEVQTSGAPFVLGILVDAVDAVLDIASGDIEMAPRFGTVNADVLHGIGKVNEGFVPLLNVQNVVCTLCLGV